MLKPQKESIILPPLQKLIIRHLAESEPQTKNKTSIRLKKQYKATNYAFNSLIGKGLISQKGTYDYRSQKHPKYWLTNKGIVETLLLGMTSKRFTSNIEHFANLGMNSAPIVFLAESLESDSPVVKSRSKELLSFLLSRMNEANVNEQTFEKTEEMLEEEREFYKNLRMEFPAISKLLLAMSAVVSLLQPFLESVMQQHSEELSSAEVTTLEEISENSSKEEITERAPIEEKTEDSSIEELDEEEENNKTLHELFSNNS